MCWDEVTDYVYRIVTESRRGLWFARHHNGRTISDPNKLAIYEVGLRDDVLHQARRLYKSSLGEACHALRIIERLEGWEPTCWPLCCVELRTAAAYDM